MLLVHQVKRLGDSSRFHPPLVGDEGATEGHVGLFGRDGTFSEREQFIALVKDGSRELTKLDSRESITKLAIFCKNLATLTNSTPEKFSGVEFVKSHNET
jgi:hypothetical protein